MRKLIYVSERILNIQDLEKEIKKRSTTFRYFEKRIEKNCTIFGNSRRCSLSD